MTPTELQDWLLLFTRPLSKNVVCEVKQDVSGLLFVLTAPPHERGALIGRRAQTIEAIRTIVMEVGLKNGNRAVVKVR